VDGDAGDLFHLANVGGAGGGTEPIELAGEEEELGIGAGGVAVPEVVEDGVAEAATLFQDAAIEAGAGGIFDGGLEAGQGGGAQLRLAIELAHGEGEGLAVAGEAAELPPGLEVAPIAKRAGGAAGGGEVVGEVVRGEREEVGAFGEALCFAEEMFVGADELQLRDLGLERGEERGGDGHGAQEVAAKHRQGQYTERFSWHIMDSLV